jgi:hypothetical protein
LVNATYQASFKYVNGVQRILINKTSLSTEVVPAVNFLVPWRAGDGEPWSNETFQSSTEWPACTTEDIDCFWNPASLRTMSYHAILDAFSNYILGVVRGHGLGTESRVMSTVLSRSDELAIVQDHMEEGISHALNRSYAEYLDQRNQSKTLGWNNFKPQSLHMPFKDAVEQLFENVTLSLMSSPNLQ